MRETGGRRRGLFFCGFCCVAPIVNLFTYPMVRTPKIQPRGRPSKYTDEQIAEWTKLIESGEETYTSLGRKFGRSRQWIWGLLNQENPTGKNRRIKCLDCEGTFYSRAKYKIERCQLCGSPWFAKPFDQRKPDEVWPPPGALD